jgi:protein involved in polysaccharide export with SLBB domain
MQYGTWIGLLSAALSVSFMVIPTMTSSSSAAPLVDTTSHTHQLAQAQPTAQAKTVQRIHIAVIGEVERPGAYFLAQADGSSTVQQQLPTVTQAIQMAGGITEHADIRQVQVRRRTSNSSQPTIISVNLYELVSKGDVSQDISLQEGDAVVVMPIQR